MKPNFLIKIIGLASFSIALIACKSDRSDEELPLLSLQDSYTISRFKVLDIDPKFTGKLTWSVNDSIISETNILEFISPYAKTYPLTLKVENNGSTQIYHSKIIVTKELNPFSKYIADVFDFKPAVGQFINELPEYTSGNTADQMIQKAKTALIGENSTMISLGGFGGYVVFGFDHTIPNMPGKDFKILGNAFFGSNDNNERSGSCEPGIIMVAYDKNKNGKPDDDEWYEIAGSEYFKNTTIKDYSLTYYKPTNNKPAVPGTLPWQIDIEHVKWEDNKGSSGFITQNSFHTQSYFPLWINDSTYNFKGTKLANNYFDQNGDGSYWVGKSYEYGYVDNAPNDDEASNIDISWAVDKNGNYVKLPGIDFIKVYTAINQETGWLGEVSTEVSGAYNLHMK